MICFPPDWMQALPFWMSKMDRPVWVTLEAPVTPLYIMKPAVRESPTKTASAK